MVKFKCMSAYLSLVLASIGSIFSKQLKWHLLLTWTKWLKALHAACKTERRSKTPYLYKFLQLKRRKRNQQNQVGKNFQNKTNQKNLP